MVIFGVEGNEGETAEIQLFENHISALVKETASDLLDQNREVQDKILFYKNQKWPINGQDIIMWEHVVTNSHSFHIVESYKWGIPRPITYVFGQESRGKA